MSHPVLCNLPSCYRSCSVSRKATQRRSWTIGSRPWTRLTWYGAWCHYGTVGFQPVIPVDLIAHTHKKTKKCLNNTNQSLLQQVERFHDAAIIQISEHCHSSMKQALGTHPIIVNPLCIVIIHFVIFLLGYCIFY